jgi:hypothetical protein
VLAEAYDRSKSARRAVVRAGLAGEQVAGERRQPSAPAAASTSDDPDARVPMPAEGATSGVEIW